jgi:hypothetical protein
MEIFVYLTVVFTLMFIYSLLEVDKNFRIFCSLSLVLCISTFLIWYNTFEEKTKYLPIQESVINNSKVQYYILNTDPIFLTPVYDVEISMVEIKKSRPGSLKRTEINIIPKIKFKTENSNF